MFILRRENFGATPRARLLLVVGEAQLRLVLAELLEGLGYDILAVGSPAEAARMKADAVLLDRELDAEPHAWGGVPVIALGGYPAPGFRAVLPKPYCLTELHRILTQEIQGSDALAA